MPFTFTFDLSQQVFELRCTHGTRRLSKRELLDLIEQCEQHYYSGRPKDWYGQPYDVTADLIKLGKQLYRWLDGNEGWLRSLLSTGQSQAIAFDLNYSLEVLELNPETNSIALGLAHLPWELLHDGTAFLLETQRITIPPMRVVQRRTEVRECANRPLHLLLMATSPEGIEPVLSYEKEEADIVEATKNQPLLLVVEESGSVSELKNLIQFYPNHYFDGFHLTGHGLIFTQKDCGSLVKSIQPMPQIADNTPCFITEDELGNVQLTTAPDLANAFGDRFPSLVFLSGCHTGEAPDQGSVPAMAQALVKAGAQVVLGWARPVFDRTGIVAAQALYRELAAGSSLEQAVKVTVVEMIQEKCSDWHLLRVYCDSRGLPPLVTPMGTARRERLRRITPEQDFLDAQDQVKVAGEFEFVGRRRPLQRCLQVMKPTSDLVGVFIQGMGGLGKSTLAARLCRRVQAQRPGFQRVVLVGVVNEINLLQKLSAAYESVAEIPQLLNQPGLSLKGRLQNFIRAVEELDRPLLLVLDDFEQNIPESDIRAGTLRPITPATEVLTALCGALGVMQQEMSAMSRVMVTCRYVCPFPPSLHLERLEQMNATDIDKKCRLLPDYTQVKQHPQYRRVIQVADGNPRLLEWLLKLLQQPEVDTATLLSQLEQTEQRFRENILAEKLLESLTQAEREFLAQASVFHLPVTQATLTAVVGDLRPLEKTLALGLVESATSPKEPEYRVPSILEPLLDPVLTEAAWKTAQQQATQASYRCWWQEVETSTEAQRLEIVRLALLGEVEEIAGKVGDAIGTNWTNSARFLEALELYQAILPRFPNDHRILRGIARTEAVLGQVELANLHYQQALKHCPPDDLPQRSSILFNQAFLIAQQGDIPQALTLYSQSLQIYEQINDVQGKATTLNQMAGILAQQGDINQALTLYNQSLQITEQINDVKGKAVTLHNMAGILAQQGDIPQALTLYNQSLQIKEQINDVQGKAATLANMAGIFAQQGDIPQALTLYNQSLQILEQINDVQGKAAILANMAGIFAQQGNIPQALTLYNQSLQITEQINDVQGKAAILASMAGILTQQGDIPQALTLYNQSLQILEQINDVKGKAATLHQMAGILAQQGDINQALTLYNQSLQITEQINDVKGKAGTLHAMAGILAQQGDINQALTLYNQSLQITEQINDVKGKAATLANMAGIFAQQGDINQALTLYNQALQILEQINDVQGKAAVLANMAGIFAQQGDINQALTLYNQSLQIYEQINDVQSKAAILANMAGIFAQQGDINQALTLYNQSLQIKEQINDVKGKAAILANMAYWAGKMGDRPRQIELYLQAAQALGQVRAYMDLFTVLSNLGVAAETDFQQYKAQAVWLLLRIQSPLLEAIVSIKALYEVIPQGDDLEALLANFARFLCTQRGQGHPQIEQLQALSWKMLSEASVAQGVETQEAFDAWFTRNELNDRTVFLPRLNDCLEALIADTWVFDPTPLQCAEFI